MSVAALEDADISACDHLFCGGSEGPVMGRSEMRLKSRSIVVDLVQEDVFRIVLRNANIELSAPGLALPRYARVLEYQGKEAFDAGGFDVEIDSDDIQVRWPSLMVSVDFNAYQSCEQYTREVL